jgi:hypothetical protein
MKAQNRIQQSVLVVSQYYRYDSGLVGNVRTEPLKRKITKERKLTGCQQKWLQAPINNFKNQRPHRNKIAKPQRVTKSSKTSIKNKGESTVAPNSK